MRHFSHTSGSSEYNFMFYLTRGGRTNARSGIIDEVWNVTSRQIHKVAQILKEGRRQKVIKSDRVTKKGEIYKKL